MAIELKKGRGEVILARVKGPRNLILVKKGIRVVEEFKIRVMFFINPKSRSCYWCLDGIQMNLLATSSLLSMGELSQNGSGRKINVRTRYERPVLLMVEDWEKNQTPCLLDENMSYLSGSNLHGDARSNEDAYRLCLGSQADIFDIKMVDSLLFGTANNDLSWKGGSIQGESRMITVDQKRRRFFYAREWQTIRKCNSTIPNEIIDCVDALKK